MEQAVIAHRALLDAAARRDWALDRALPMLAGEIQVSDDVLQEVLREVAGAVNPQASKNEDMRTLEQARAAYAARDLAVAAARYAKVAKTSPLWPDALRERAWTLLLLGRPGEALGATVSLKAPYFAFQDHAEGRLMKATVLLQKCRFEEARTEIAQLADAPVRALPEADAEQSVQANAAPHTPGAEVAWNAPLVLRVRAALAETGSDETTRLRLVRLGGRLLSNAFNAESETARDAKERALKIRYESLRLERRLIEEGKITRSPAPASLPPLNDDEVAWTFDGTFWRDELGNYRYSAGDACPPGERQ
jgi:hypothetical protein